MCDETILARFKAKVRVLENGCHEWTGAKIRCGYGIFALTKKKHPVAHRFIYEAVVGPIAKGLVIDHLCHNRACVNPAHLEAVTQQVNILRGVGLAPMYAARTHCGHGHEFTEENTVRDKKGYRACRACRNEKSAERSRAYRAEFGPTLNEKRRLVRASNRS